MINALDAGMVASITAALERWRDDDAVAAVLIDGAGERGLCAGGDVRALRTSIIEGHPEQALAFFRAEYAMNLLIASYPKPIIAFADGLTMGGGIGLAGHASVRVVTERSALAMPETRIGFTPDVGATWLLAHAPGRLGEYLSLTGAVMNGADAIAAGLADVFVPSTRLDALAEALASNDEPPAQTVRRFSGRPDVGALTLARDWIDEAFARDRVSEIIRALRELGGDAAQAADLLDELSPSSLTVALSAVRAARSLPDLRTALAREFDLAAFLIGRHDLVEGIRAQLVDKDRDPKWQPPTIEDVPTDFAATAGAFRATPPLWT